MKSKHRAGGVVSSSHTTVIGPAGKLVDAATKYGADKIILGRITHGLHGSTPQVKFEPISSGLKAVVRGAFSKQEVFILTPDQSGMQSALAGLFEDRQKKRPKGG